MDGPNIDVNAFGEGFEGFPKRLPEDCVEYSLFIIDDRLMSQKEILSRLEVVRRESLKLTGTLLSRYIWQRESFSLVLEREKGPAHLHGLVNYGDSIEDEWLIVYILKQLSKQFSDLWIKVVDTDGEFLLIEAANALPRWLNPEIADNRVWIHQNKLRIIPIKHQSNPPKKDNIPLSRPLTLDEAYKIISSTPDSLIHSPLIEEEAFYRLRNYPSQIEASLHHAVVTIPRKLAYILHDHPAYIAPAAEAFYLRDPISLKSLLKKPSELIFSPEDLVTVSTRFTRVIYAQLNSQQFSPPLAWKSLLPQADNEDGSHILSSESVIRLELGIKVASGFEMLINDLQNSDNRMIREIKILADEITTDINLELPTDEDIAKWNDAGRQDDEAWMDINFEDFEKELDGKNPKSKSGAVPGAFGPERPPGFGDPKTQADLKKMVERFESFLNDEDAGIDGAEIDDMDIDDDDEDESEEDSEDEDKDVSFDEKEFARMMREMMGMPPEDAEEITTTTNNSNSRAMELRDDVSEEEDQEDEAQELKKVMDQMEVELREAGALNLDSPADKHRLLPGTKLQPEKDGHEKSDEDSDSESEGDINIDFNLAKNLLESFKSQAGMSGPGGNLLGMMGMQLPRDEDDSKTINKAK